MTFNFAFYRALWETEEVDSCMSYYISIPNNFNLLDKSGSEFFNKQKKRVATREVWATESFYSRVLTTLIWCSEYRACVEVVFSGGVHVVAFLNFMSRQRGSIED